MQQLSGTPKNVAPEAIGLAVVPMPLNEMTEETEMQFLGFA